MTEIVDPELCDSDNGVGCGERSKYVARNGLLSESIVVRPMPN
jgi:hypothetical protein